MSLLLWILACDPPPPSAGRFRDADGDGFRHHEDCDDADRSTHPGAADPLFDHRDQNCDGADGIDADGDRWTARSAGGMDCDDADPRVRPVARERWYDGVDDDCDGRDDCDRDGDGWPADPLGIGICPAIDCDDADPNQRPNDLREIPYNGVDDNCDLRDGDGDADRDGWWGIDYPNWLASPLPPPPQHELDDCWDSYLTHPPLHPPVRLARVMRPADVHPAAEDPPWDGLDQDCDGSDTSPWLLGEVPLEAAHARYLAADPADFFGAAVAWSDGAIIGAPRNDRGGRDAGAIFIYDGSVFDGRDQPVGLLVGPHPDARLGARIAAGDLNEDGVADLLLGGGVAGMALGPITGSRMLGDETLGRSLGAPIAVATGDDWTSDGWTDAVLGDPGEDRVSLLSGPLSVLPARADAVLLSERPVELGAAVASPGDIDGDGLPDLLVSAPRWSDRGGKERGAVLLVRGGEWSNTLTVGDIADGVLGAWSGERAGSAVAGAGDLNGDGLADVVIGAPWRDAEPGPPRRTWRRTRGADAGAAYVLLGPLTGLRSATDARARLVGEARDDWAGSRVAAAGDVDGDDNPDLLIGASGLDRAGPNGGGVYVVCGPVTGVRSLSTATALVISESAGDGVGAGGIITVGDIDSDGRSDLLIGAPLHDASGADAGAAYLLTARLR